MAILDFLVPDLAPEQYSSGQGTGYAQQYNLGAPNPFDVAQDYMNSMLQQKKLEQEKDLLNEKTRQEKLNQYISSIEYDPKWEIARSDFENKVNEIGDFVSEWRASGKPINQDFHMGLNKLKGELNTMKSENEKSYETYNKNMQTMIGSLGKDYNDEDVKAYDKAVTDAYKNGGINAGFKTISTVKPLKQFDLITWLKKDFPVATDETGKLLQTDPKRLDEIANSKYFDLSTDRKKEVMNDLYINNQIPEETPEETIKYFRRQLDLWAQKKADKPKEFDLNKYFSENFPKPEDLSSLTESTKKEELDDYANQRWLQLDNLYPGAKEQLIKNLYDNKLIESEDAEAAKKYIRDNVVTLYDTYKVSQLRSTPKTDEGKTAEKTRFEPSKKYQTTKFNDTLKITVPKYAEFENENGEKVYIKPTETILRGTDGAFLVGKRLVREGDQGYFESKKDAEAATSDWERENNQKATVEQDPDTKKYIIVTGNDEFIPIGKGQYASNNLASFKVNYGKDVESEFERLLAAENNRLEGTTDWMQRNFYGEVNYANKKLKK
jgi:hypothetical protein